MIFSRIIRWVLLGFLLIVPFVAVADDVLTEPLFTDGTVMKTAGSFKKYFFFEGKKWKIADAFTFRELGLAVKDIVIVERKQLSEIPDGDVLKIEPPKVKGIIDAHEHFRVLGDMRPYLRVAKKLGIRKTVFLPTGSAPDNAGFEEHTKALLLEQKKHPTKIIAFCTAYDGDPQAPALFEECLKNGGKGLKLMSGHPNFYVNPLDSDTMRSLFEVAREYSVPIIIHVSILRLPSAKEEFKKILDEFPDVKVLIAHLCNAFYREGGLLQCGEMMDTYPNLYSDLSMGSGLMGFFEFVKDHREEVIDFVTAYRDRLLYGTDMILTANDQTRNEDALRERLMCDISLLQERWFRCSLINKKHALLPGLELSQETLSKILVENPKAFLRSKKDSLTES